MMSVTATEVKPMTLFCHETKAHACGLSTSKLESGQRANPTVETLVRYAEAVGKRVLVSLTDA